MALLGWIVFLYWWWIVFRRVSSHEVRFTLLFVVVALVVIVGVTAAWAWHNLRLYRRRGPRTHVREAHADFSRDGLGRPVAFAGSSGDVRLARVVLVRVDDAGKRYEAASAVPARNGPRRWRADPASAETR